MKPYLRSKSFPAIIPGDMSVWKANRTGDYHVLLLGDSVGAGVNANAPITTNGWAYQLFADFRTRYGEGGTFLSALNNLVGVNEMDQWTITAGWYGTSGYGLHNALVNNHVAGTATCTLTGSTFEVINLISGISAAYSIKFDAEAPTSIGGPGSNGFLKNTYNKSAGAHTIQFTHPATDWAWMCGITARTGSGPIYVNSSISGQAIDAFDGGWLQGPIAAALPTSLVIVALTLNDYNAQTPLATYQSRLQTLVTSIGAESSILLMACNPGYIAGRTIPTSSYGNVVRAVAAANHCGFINIGQLWGNTWPAAQAKGFMGADNLHPIQAGHDNYYQVVRDFLIA